MISLAEIESLYSDLRSEASSLCGRESFVELGDGEVVSFDLNMYSDVVKTARIMSGRIWLSCDYDERIRRLYLMGYWRRVLIRRILSGMPVLGELIYRNYSDFLSVRKQCHLTFVGLNGECGVFFPERDRKYIFRCVWKRRIRRYVYEISESPRLSSLSFHAVKSGRESFSSLVSPPASDARLSDMKGICADSWKRVSVMSWSAYRERRNRNSSLDYARSCAVETRDASFIIDMESYGLKTYGSIEGLIYHAVYECRYLPVFYRECIKAGVIDSSIKSKIFSRMLVSYFPIKTLLGWESTRTVREENGTCSRVTLRLTCAGAEWIESWLKEDKDRMARHTAIYGGKELTDRAFYRMGYGSSVIKPATRFLKLFKSKSVPDMKLDEKALTEELLEFTDALQAKESEIVQ